MAHKNGIEPRLEPLTPRSIVLSLLLGSHPAEMSVRHICEFTSLFDIADGAVRTALSRLVTADDLVNDGGTYRLTARLLERQAQQDAGRTGPPAAWDGTWWIATVLADRRTVAERRHFRTRVLGARFGELRPDTWMRPANVPVPLDLPDVVLTRGLLHTGSEGAVVAHLWDLDQLDRHARSHLARLDATADGIAEAFATLAACQRFLRIEPQLPRDLSSSGIAGDLRGRYDEVVTSFQDRLAAFFAERRVTGAQV